jgi:hypothetical protein
LSDFDPILSILPAPQRRLWPELSATPAQFTLYGGTALALRLGHRSSVDFDFFSNDHLDPDLLARAVPYLHGAERVQVAPDTLTCRVDRDGDVLVSFFGGLDLGHVLDPDVALGTSIKVASLLDIAATKLAVVQKRAEEKDYIDVDAILRSGVTLTEALIAARTVYGERFNPVVTLKALSYFDDVASLPPDVRGRLSLAVADVNVASLASRSTAS